MMVSFSCYVPSEPTSLAIWMIWLLNSSKVKVDSVNLIMTLKAAREMSDPDYPPSLAKGQNGVFVNSAWCKTSSVSFTDSPLLMMA